MTRSPLHRALLSLPLVFVAVAGLACRSMQPSIASGGGAEISHDGLHRVHGTRRFEAVWIKPDADLARYGKILTVDAGVHYTRHARSGRDEFPLSETQLERLHEGLRAAIEDSIEQDGRWGRAEQRGPDVLVLRVALIDVFLASPPEGAGRDRTYGSTAGQATLIVEVFDSQSLEILARIVDRRAAERDASSWRNDEITNSRAAKRLFTIWARRLVEALDVARSMASVEPSSPAVDRVESAPGP